VAQISKNKNNFPKIEFFKRTFTYNLLVINYLKFGTFQAIQEYHTHYKTTIHEKPPSSRATDYPPPENCSPPLHHYFIGIAKSIRPTSLASLSQATFVADFFAGDHLIYLFEGLALVLLP
jgi:hypothetical protein